MNLVEQTVQEALMPVPAQDKPRDVVRLIAISVAGFAVVFVYIGLPVALVVGERLDSLVHSLAFAAAMLALGISAILSVLHGTNIDLDPDRRTPRTPVAALASTAGIAAMIVFEVPKAPSTVSAVLVLLVGVAVITAMWKLTLTIRDRYEVQA